jgi:hypothetical protein
VYLIGPDIVPEYFPLSVNFPVFSHSSWFSESIVNIGKPKGLGIGGVVFGIEGIEVGSLIPSVVVFSFMVVVDISFIVVITGLVFGQIFCSISKIQHWFVAFSRIFSFLACC